MKANAETVLTGDGTNEELLMEAALEAAVPRRLHIIYIASTARWKRVTGYRTKNSPTSRLRCELPDRLKNILNSVQEFGEVTMKANTETMRWRPFGDDRAIEDAKTAAGRGGTRMAGNEVQDVNVYPLRVMDDGLTATISCAWRRTGWHDHAACV